MNYAPSKVSPACECRKRNPVAPTFCSTGHMTECHWPLGCEQANCNHYRSHLGDEEAEEGNPFDPELAELRDEAARERLASLADAGCEKCEGVGTFTVTTSADARQLEHITGSRTIEFHHAAVCACVRATVVERVRQIQKEKVD